MQTDGTLSGRLWLFGAVPPLIITGRWWFELPSSLVWDFVAVLYVPPEGPVINRFRVPLPITRIDENQITFQGDTSFATILQRVA